MVLVSSSSFPDLQFGFCLGLDLGLQRRLRFHLGFSFDASGVLCSGFPVNVVGGHASSCIGGLDEQFVESGGVAFRVRVNGGASLRHVLGPRWPWVVCGDGSLVLALEGNVHCGDVGFELSPPPRHALRFPRGLELLLRWLPGKTAAFQLGLGIRGGFPNADFHTGGSGQLSATNLR